MLIEGVPHENVFAFLDKKKKESKQDMNQLLLLRFTIKTSIYIYVFPVISRGGLIPFYG